VGYPRVDTLQRHGFGSSQTGLIQGDGRPGQKLTKNTLNTGHAPRGLRKKLITTLHSRGAPCKSQTAFLAFGRLSRIFWPSLLGLTPVGAATVGNYPSSLSPCIWSLRFYLHQWNNMALVPFGTRGGGDPRCGSCGVRGYWLLTMPAEFDRPARTHSAECTRLGPHPAGQCAARGRRNFGARLRGPPATWWRPPLRL